MDLEGDHPKSDGQGYRVLARAYRPAKLSELIGQDILVRALSNAFASGRIAHAFLLSGIRGVGKTTTARIIARALNCSGADGQGGPTTEPCGVCSSCMGIASDSALDVIEMDAATHTGINDIREIVESIGYAPAASRYKVYIIDEVHMLSINAFNGLLKTLEEPPPHAKFIFATTESRKVPITVLSRCQRFELRRVEVPVLQKHLQNICTAERIDADEQALALIATAAEGSVRDSLSLLDQATALSNGKIEGGAVAAMLGYGRKDDILALLAMLLQGDTGPAVDRVRELYGAGTEPAAVVQDLLELTHELSTIKASVPRHSSVLMGVQASKARELASAHGLERFSRLWQMLLKGLDEVRQAPQPLAAMEMLSLRCACASQLPPPGELLAILRNGDGDSKSATTPALRSVPTHERSPSSNARALGLTQGIPQQTVNAQPAPAALPGNFEAMIALLHSKKHYVVAASLEQNAHLISYQPLRLTLRLAPNVATDFSGKLNHALMDATGERWVIILESDGGDDTLVEQRRFEKVRLMDEFAELPAIKNVLTSIPGAKIVDVRHRHPDED